MNLLEEINDLQAMALGVEEKATEDKEEATSTSAALEPVSCPTLNGVECGLMSLPLNSGEDWV